MKLPYVLSRRWSAFVLLSLTLSACGGDSSSGEAGGGLALAAHVEPPVSIAAIGSTEIPELYMLKARASLGEAGIAILAERCFVEKPGVDQDPDPENPHAQLPPRILQVFDIERKHLDAAVRLNFLSDIPVSLFESEAQSCSVLSAYKIPQR
ncbi:MAG: hypothetical protein EOO22_02360 [Comamonadaceae bacterium]|nr:MAG: hypothetical protein EOO22_02360 [Comamonadaceae bacterium]